VIRNCYSSYHRQDIAKGSNRRSSVKNYSLKTKADGLADEVAQLKSDLEKAQELANQRRVEAESKEKDLQQHLQSALDSLLGTPDSSFSMRFMRVSSIC
jgi:hypothetical protein